ncbi:hypothetical protein QYE76_056040 [Lolium multiflorum]|uniref:Sulfite exporter TauE/SafE family protein n=1 Tax=Lolium multiflorum TaxID=4521 RepID=A0AAD8T263_LOLMU|nr:hypothetical protein QYE76_056040 [Lolium multiflorum]
MNSSQLLTAARAINSTIYQSPWSSHVTAMESSLQLQRNLRTVLPCVLSFVAAAISSAGGVGGGSLYVPILNVVAGLSIKTSTAFSTFMVTGGTLSNVLYTLLVRGSRPDGQPLIDYDIAVVSQPCLLLGVSVRVAWRHVPRVAHLRAFLCVPVFRDAQDVWHRDEAVARRDGGEEEGAHYCTVYV